jgi:hypothetical protein
MAATVGIMRFTTRSLFVPNILVSALLIKEFLWAPSTIRADSLFYAMTRTLGGPLQACKKDRPGRRAQAAGKMLFKRSLEHFHCMSIQGHLGSRGFSVRKSHTSQTLAVLGNSEKL